MDRKNYLGKKGARDTALFDGNGWIVSGSIPDKGVGG